MSLGEKLLTLWLITVLSSTSALSSSGKEAVLSEVANSRPKQSQRDKKRNNQNVLAVSCKQGVTLYQYNPETKELDKVWDSVTLGGQSINSVYQPFIGDADNDGENELIGLDLYGLLAWDNAGRMPSSFVELGEFFPTWGRNGLAIVADVNGDGINEILAGFCNHVYIWKLENNRFEKLLEKKDFPNGVLHSIWSIDVGDTTGDGINEIAVAGKSNEGKGLIPIYRWQKNILKETGKIVPPTWLTYRIRIGDVNNDGVDEIVTTTRDGIARVYKYDENTKTYQPIWESKAISAAGMDLGDVDNDGVKEIVIATRLYPAEGEKTNRAFVFKYDGSTFKEVWSGESPVSSSWPGVSIGDITNDGINEFIINGRVIFKYNPPQAPGEEPSFQLFKILDRKDVRYGVVGLFNPTNEINKDNSYRLFLQSLYTDGGGNNNILEPGEEVKVNVVIRSLWSKAKDVKVSISQEDNPYVKIIKGISSIGEIAANSTASTEKDPFIIKIADNAPANSRFWFRVLMSTKDGYSNLMFRTLARDHDPYVNPLTISSLRKSEQAYLSHRDFKNYVEINESDSIKENDLDYILANHKYVVLNVSATWCTYCKALKPAYIATSMLFEDVYFAYVNIDKPKQNVEPIKKRFPKVFVLPTILFIEDNKEIGQPIYGMPKKNRFDNVNYLTEKIKQYFQIE